MRPKAAEVQIEPCRRLGQVLAQVRWCPYGTGNYVADPSECSSTDEEALGTVPGVTADSTPMATPCDIKCTDLLGIECAANPNRVHGGGAECINHPV